MHYVAGEDAAGVGHVNVCRRISALCNANASDIMQWLLDLKGDPCALNMDRMSPLACAVFKDCARTAELLLLAQPSTLRVHDANGDLPLHLALLEGSSAALQVLLKHGADWFDRNERGETSFDLYKTVLQAGNEQGKLQRLIEVMQHLISLANNARDIIR
jgi:ankyrin repeat protein